MAALPSETSVSRADATATFARWASRLGDGYRRLAAHGINNNRETYRVTYVRMPHAEAATLVAALKALNGVTSVDWTPPDEVTSRKWTVERVGHRWTSSVSKQVTITLKEFFGP